MKETFDIYLHEESIIAYYPIYARVTYSHESGINLIIETISFNGYDLMYLKNANKTMYEIRQCIEKRIKDGTPG